MTASARSNCCRRPLADASKARTLLRPTRRVGTSRLSQQRIYRQRDFAVAPIPWLLLSALFVTIACGRRDRAVPITPSDLAALARQPNVEVVELLPRHHRSARQASRGPRWHNLSWDPTSRRRTSDAALAELHATGLAPNVWDRCRAGRAGVSLRFGRPVAAHRRTRASRGLHASR